MLDEAFDHRSWHGTTLLGSIRGVSAADAAWRPSPRRHNVWELTVHAAYWKYAVRRRLAGEKRGAFRLKGSNWFARPETQRRASAAGAPDGGALADLWAEDVALLIDEHRKLRRTVAAIPAPRLLAEMGGSAGVTPAYLVRGIAAHDLYHAGQIQLLKRLRRRL